MNAFLDRRLRTESFLNLASFLVLQFLILPCAGQAPEEITSAWKTVMRQVRPYFLSLNADMLPKDYYPTILDLAQTWKIFSVMEVSDNEAETWWKAHYPTPFPSEKMEMIKTAVRRSKFADQNAAGLTRVRKAAGGVLYEKMVENGSIEGKPAACFVFVPYPCPSQKDHERAIEFMTKACEKAEQNKFKVVIVQSFYGHESDPAGKLAKELSTTYEKFIQSGTVKIVDALPGGTSTPWGFLFRSGEFILDGGTDGWQQDPEPILKEFHS